ncbi:hypothetical protein [Microbacterium halotolerans]|uniref:hypothetical protein n=1 Tax=Microbacterium halotolerans TaxID=246613 RepID=UPI0013C2C571|nr:hypothetical protein [Microbacterium halotolerans]
MKAVFTACVVLAGTLCLVACSPSAPPVGQVVKGLPEGWEGPEPDLLAAETTVGWADGGTSFGVVTIGSSSCPVVARSLTTEPPDEITITFEAAAHEECTADSAVTTHVFDLPSEIVESPITIVAEIAGQEIELRLR